MLSVSNLSVSYGKINAVRSLNLTVGDGEFVTLIGANGAGKSTTLKAIAGIQKANAGQIVFNGQDLTNVPYFKAKQAGITLIPEGRQLFPEMTVIENLEMGFYGSNDKSKKKELQEQVFEYFPDLYPKRHQKAALLSGGQQQMVAIGRGIMAQPKLMMLDEPSLGLSPLLVQTVAAIITRLHETGMSILLVEQNAKLALELAQRGYVLEMGAVALEGEAKSLLANRDVQTAYLGI
jgi:branched-chain amino acid transport system ATP-binding protein